MKATTAARHSSISPLPSQACPSLPCHPSIPLHPALASHARTCERLLAPKEIAVAHNLSYAPFPLSRFPSLQASTRAQTGSLWRSLSVPQTMETLSDDDPRPRFLSHTAATHSLSPPVSSSSSSSALAHTHMRMRKTGEADGQPLFSQRGKKERKQSNPNGQHACSHALPQSPPRSPRFGILALSTSRSPPPPLRRPSVCPARSTSLWRRVCPATSGRPLSFKRKMAENCSVTDTEKKNGEKNR